MKMNIYTYDEKVIEELRKRYLAGEAIVADFSRLHNMLWGWLSDNPGKKKADWPLWKYQGGWIDEKLLHAYCFACTVVPWVSDILLCPKCPIDWGSWNDGKKKTCLVGLFRAWETALYYDKFKEASRIASEIAGLPWNGRKEFTLQKGEDVETL